MLRTLAPALIVLLSALACPGCGGGGGGAGGGGAAAAPVATAAVSFPISGAITDAERIGVVGTAQPGATSITRVRVGGLSAATADSFATWNVDVPLEFGLNELEVVVEDDAGEAVVARVEIERRALRRSVLGLSHEKASGVTYAIDEDRFEVVALAGAGEEPVLISGDGRGSGPAFEQPSAITGIPEAGTLFVTDSMLDRIFQVDVVTGDRTLLALGGDALDLQLTAGIALVEDGSRLVVVSVLRLYVVDLVQESVKEVAGVSDILTDIAVDEGTGELFALALDQLFRFDPDAESLTPVTASGVFDLAVAVDVDPDTGQVFVAETTLISTGASTLFAVDPGTGAAEVVFDLGATAALALAFDEGSRRVLASVGRGQVLAVDPTTSSSDVVLDVRRGAGPPFGRLSQLDVSNGRWFGLDSVADVAIELDPGTGDRRQVVGAGGEGSLAGSSDLAIGGPPERLFATQDTPSLIDLDPVSGLAGELPIQFPGAESVAVSAVERLASGELLLADPSGRVFRVEPASGDAVEVVDEGDPGSGGVGSAAQVSGLGFFVVDGAGTRAFLVDVVGTEIVEVDLETGRRRTLTLSPDDVADYSGLAADAAGTTLYVSDRVKDRLVAVDVESGAVTVVAGDERGSGPPVDTLVALRVDESRGQLLGYSLIDEALIAVHLLTGDRVVLSR